MLNVKLEKEGNSSLALLSGTVDEAANFEKSFGKVTGPLILDCGEISRINSVGVKKWVTYFQGLGTAGIKIEMRNLSNPIIEQLNTIKNFHCGAKVVSLKVPFLCAKCNTRLDVLMSPDEIKKTGFELPDQKCTKCGSGAAFDDFADEFFVFLRRS